MPYTYLRPDQFLEPTGNKAVDESLKTLIKVTGWDYRVSMIIAEEGILWWKKTFPLFSVYSPTSCPGEFGVNDFNGHMYFNAPEETVVAYLEGMHWGALDERQRQVVGNHLLMAQATQRLQELRRLEGVIAELQKKKG
jgi:hypothetical protein